MPNQKSDRRWGKELERRMARDANQIDDLIRRGRIPGTPAYVRPLTETELRLGREREEREYQAALRDCEVLRGRQVKLAVVRNTEEMKWTG